MSSATAWPAPLGKSRDDAPRYLEPLQQQDPHCRRLETCERPLMPIWLLEPVQTWLQPRLRQTRSLEPFFGASPAHDLSVHLSWLRRGEMLAFVCGHQTLKTFQGVHLMSLATCQ